MSSSKTVRKLQVVSPVPADIDIANSVEPLHISEIAQELNLSPNHYDLYGKYKAKVNVGKSINMDVHKILCLWDFRRFCFLGMVHLFVGFIGLFGLVLFFCFIFLVWNRVNFCMWVVLGFWVFIYYVPVCICLYAYYASIKCGCSCMNNLLFL